MGYVAIAVLAVTLSFISPATRIGSPPYRPEERIRAFFAHGLVYLVVNRDHDTSILALFDTGANTSAIDAEIGMPSATVESTTVVGTTGTLRAEVVRLDGLTLGSYKLPPLRATRRSLGGLLAPTGQRVQMILGTDALQDLAITLNFADSSASASTTSPASFQRSIPMPMDNGIPLLPVTLGTEDVQLRLDTGASLFASRDIYVNLPRPLALRIRADDPSILPVTKLLGTGADGKSIDLPVYVAKPFQSGGVRRDSVFLIEQPEVGYFSDAAARGFVSNNFLEKLGRITLDFPHRRLLIH